MVLKLHLKGKPCSYPDIVIKQLQLYPTVARILPTQPCLGEIRGILYFYNIFTSNISEPWVVPRVRSEAMNTPA